MAGTGPGMTARTRSRAGYPDVNCFRSDSIAARIPAPVQRNESHHVPGNSALITARAADFPLSEAPAARERPQTAANQVPDGCAHTGARRLLWHDPDFSRGGFL